MAPTTISLLLALHAKQHPISHHPSNQQGWRGVAFYHYNSLDLLDQKMKPAAQRPAPQFAGFVFDPSTNKDILLHEIEGRLLECNPKAVLQREDSTKPRSGLKVTIMIDDFAKDGSRPDYFTKKQLAFPVGFSTALPEVGKPSQMLMRLVWRDNTDPVWGEIKDPAGSEEIWTMLPMYFITTAGVPKLTQERPTYKFGADPVKTISVADLMGGQPSQKMRLRQAAVRKAEVTKSSDVASNGITSDNSTGAKSAGDVPNDQTVPGTDGDDQGDETLQTEEKVMDEPEEGDFDDGTQEIQAEGETFMW